MCLNLNAKEKNRIFYSLDVNTTGYTLTFRLKEQVENTTTPLISVLATKVIEGSTSSGYFDIDLSQAPLDALAGTYVYEIIQDDGVNPPLLYPETPATVQINIRLNA